MAGASLYRAAGTAHRGTDFMYTASVGCTQGYTGVYTGVYSGVLPVFYRFLSSKRPESAFYIFYAFTCTALTPFSLVF